MNIVKFNLELEVLENRNKKQQYINIALGLFFIALAYGYGKDWEVTKILHLDYPELWAAGLGGGLIGVALSNWKGSKELKLLKKILKEARN